MNDNNNKKAVFLGCAKNCGYYLSRTINNILLMGKQFKDFKVLIYENDSIDNTAQVLNNIKDSRFHIFTNMFINVKYPVRTWCLAYVRQELLNELIKLNYKPDYVIVLDLDDIGAKDNKGLNFIKHAIKLNEYWDVLSPKLTYDLFAFRVQNHTCNYFDILDTRNVKYIESLMKYQTSDYDYKYDKNGLMSIYSNFNGMVIYKYEVYIKGKYSGKNIYYSPLVNNRNREECEHVNFHRSLGSETRIKMCKDIIYP